MSETPVRHASGSVHSEGFPCDECATERGMDNLRTLLADAELGRAWAAAEAALPEGLSLCLRRSGVSPHYWTASAEDGTGKRWETIEEELSRESPAVALRALATAIGDHSATKPPAETARDTR